MRRKFSFLLIALLAFTSILALTGCDDIFGEVSTPDYNEDIQIIEPDKIESDNFVAKEDTTYYTSPGLSLWMEVNGAFFELDYFSLDGNKRVYDDVYLYEDDYFYMISDDFKGWYSTLSDSRDAEYAEVEYQDGYDVQINILKSGIYKVIFDVDTLKFDLEYKSEIQTPVYHTIKDCSILTNATDYVEMSVNPANEDELCLKGFKIEANEAISFLSNSHVSIYKITLDESCNEKYGSYRYPSVIVNVGGIYNVYINKKTYVVRLELTNPDTATYNCVYYDGNDFISLKPYDSSTPYIFRQRLVVDTKYTTSVPNFHTEKYTTYDLTVAESDLLLGSGDNYYFKNPGTYDIIINLKTFEISVELLPE
ncbi:MAG: hypothetical protein J6B34_03905 [Clostridia bacterium]|nr:hypothetical protein [Clostridia bacterium]